MSPMVRTALTHAGTAIGGGLAVVTLLGAKSSDIVAVYDQMNVVIAEVTKLVTVVMPLATAAYGIYKATTKSKLADIEQDPRVKGVVATPELAAELGPKVVPSAAALPVAAKVATE